MFNKIRKDQNRRILVKKFEIKRLQSKVLTEDLLLKKNLIDFFSQKKEFSIKDKKSIYPFTFTDRYKFWQNKTVKSYPRKSSKSRVQNRCIESGRSRAVLRFCKLSRIVFREKASKGYIPGVSKASW